MFLLSGFFEKALRALSFINRPHERMWERDVLEIFSKRAYTLPLAMTLCRKRLRSSLKENPVRKDAKASFSPFASGKQRIPRLAPVKSGR